MIYVGGWIVFKKYSDIKARIFYTATNFYSRDVLKKQLQIYMTIY